MPYDLVDPKDILSVECRLYAANGTVIEVLGHCKVIIIFDNKVKVESDFIVSKGVPEQMLGIDWLTKNEVHWNFLDESIALRNPVFNPGIPDQPPSESQRNVLINRVRRDDIAEKHFFLSFIFHVYLFS